MKYKFITIILIAVCFSACENENSLVLKPDYTAGCKRKYDLLLHDLLSSRLDSLNKSDSLFQHILLQKNGSDQLIDSDEFAQKVCKLTHDTILKFPLPYLKIKGTDNIVLFTTGKGLWGPVYSFVLFDTKKRLIIDLRCDHKSEAPVTEVSFKDTAYSVRYRNLKMESLPVKIDGLSGATITSEAYEKSIIEGVRKYSEIWL
jgi:hypothetical protein